MKQILSVIIALVLILCFCIPVFSAYNTTSYQTITENFSFFSDSHGAGFVSYQGGKCHYEQLSPYSWSADLSLEHTIADAAVFDSVVVALCNDVKNNQLEVYVYHVDTDVLDSFAVNDLRYYSDVGFYYGYDSIYLVSDRNANCIERYSASGTLIDRYSFNSAVTQIGCDYRGDLFALSGGTLYRMYSNRFSALSGSIQAAPVTFVDDSYLTDASGKVYRISGDTCDLIFRTDSVYAKATACIVDGILYYPKGNDIYGYQLSTCEKKYGISLADTISELYAHRGYVYAVSCSGSITVTKIRQDEFTDLSRKWDPSTSPTAFSPQSKSGDDASGNDHTIASSVYRIDFGTYRISLIPAGTTFAALKRNIIHDGYTMRLYRSGVEKKGGACGTAMTVVFESDSGSYTFELSVIGDLTGEGSVNSRDLSVLMEYLIGVTDFNGVYSLSADLSGDHIIDVKDLALLHRMI